MMMGDNNDLAAQQVGQYHDDIMMTKMDKQPPSSLDSSKQGGGEIRFVVLIGYIVP
jgi:hypothetical protein